MLHRMWHCIVPGVMLVASACHHKVNTDVAPADAAPVRVEVRNNYSLPVEVYAVGSGANQRLGTVYPGTVTAFVVPQGIVGNSSAELQAHPTANSRDVARSGPLLLAPGSVVDFVIGAQLFNSTATIRP